MLSRKAQQLYNWPIVRTKPAGRKYGRSIPLFINNWRCHLTTVDVYEDGAIDCWGFVDRELFREKVYSQWVVPAPRPDQNLSVFNFGFTGVKDGRWLQSAWRIVRYADAVLRRLNPEMRGLLDMQGSDSEVRGKVRYAKLGLGDGKPYRHGTTGTDDIPGDSVPVLRVLADAFELTRVVVYADGLCQLGSREGLLPIGDVPLLYETGRIANSAPAGSRILLPGLGEFVATTDFGHVSEHDRLGELHDKLNELNGKPSLTTACASLFEAYEREPTPTAKEALREAYEAVPSHLRRYCGDMDTRDTAIRAALYGEDGE